MPRAARVVAVGLPHHITQRGNHGIDVFYSADDRQRYLLWLGEYARLHALRIWAYCLMANHRHVVAVPGEPDSLARALRPLQMRHAQRINRDHHWSGHLWQSRYFSCPLDDDHLWAAVRYVERNPVRAGLTARAENYDWSSAPAHCRMRNDPVLSPDLPMLAAVTDWAEWLEEPEDADAVVQLKHCTLKGLPCGDDAFIDRVGRFTGARVREGRSGRPRKPRTGEAA